MAVNTMNVQTSPYSSTQSVSSNINTTATGRNQNTQDTNRNDNRNQEDRLSNVVSRSTDGDTVQVRGRENMSSADPRTGSVTMRDNNQTDQMRADQRSADQARADQNRVDQANQNRTDQTRASQMRNEQNTTDRNNAIDSRNTQAKRDDAAAQEKQRQVTSLAGMTKQQLDQLKREGRISQQQYDTQMQRRKDQLQESSDKSAEAAKIGSAADRAMTNNNLENMSTRVAFSNQSSDTISAQTRLDAMQTIRQAQEGPVSQQTRSEERRAWAYQLQA